MSRSPPSQQSTFQKILFLFLILSVVAVFVGIGLIVYSIVQKVAENTQKELQRKKIKVSSKGAHVQVKGLSYEALQDKSQQVLVNTWNTGTTNGYKAPFWAKNPKDKKGKSGSGKAMTSAAVTSFVPTPPAACVTVRDGPDALILIGTYKLDEATGERTGSLLLYKLGRDASELTEIQTLNLTPSYGSVLDIALPDTDVILVATSRGRILAFTLQNVDGDGDVELTLSSENKLFDDGLLVLSLAVHPAQRDRLSCTLSDSSVSLLKLSRGGGGGGHPPSLKVEITSTVGSAHEGLEAWTSAMDGGGSGSGTTTLYTGGDDGAFVTWNVADASDDGPVEVLRNRRAHGAGVTAILPVSGGLVLTGSYDSKIRAYDAGSRRFVGEMDLEGGVWRLQKLQEVEGGGGGGRGKRLLVLASCMHAGCRIVQVDVSTPQTAVQFKVLAKMEEHESMNYASAAVKHGEGGGEGWRIVSTSFYDRRVCLWRFDIRNSIAAADKDE